MTVMTDSVVGPRPSDISLRIIDRSRAVEKLRGDTNYATAIRLVTIGAVAYGIYPSVNDVVLISAFWPGDLSNGLWALAATAVFLPLHIRHVWYGAHAAKPPAGHWTLLAMALVIFAALPLAGGHWVRSFSTLAASALIVLRPPWSVIAFGSVVAMGVPTALVADDVGMATSIWNALMVLWRALILFVLVWLAAALRRLQAARRALADDAVARERRRIDGELQRNLGAALASIVTRGQRISHRLGGERAAGQEKELQILVDGSRQTLAKARRMIRGYQQVSLQAELDTAAALLTAAGIETIVVLPRGSLPEHVELSVRSALRSATTRLLRDSTARSCVITVTKDGRLRLETRAGDLAIAEVLAS